MINKIQTIKYSLIAIFNIFITSYAHASAIDDASKDSYNLAIDLGYSVNSQQSPLFFVGTIIRYALGFVGIIFLALTIINGFKWMTAGGNEEDVKKAKTGIINTIKGLAIITIAYVITTLLQTMLSTITKTR